MVTEAMVKIILRRAAEEVLQVELEVRVVIRFPIRVMVRPGQG